MNSFPFLVVLLSFSFPSKGADPLFVPGHDFHYDGAICRFENFYHRYDKNCPWGWNVTRDRNAKIARARLDYWHPPSSWAQYPVFHPFCCRPAFPFEQYKELTCKWSGTSPFCRGECEKGWMDMTVADVVDMPENDWQDEFGKTCYNGFKYYCCKG